MSDRAGKRRGLTRTAYAVMSTLPSACLLTLVVVFGYSINYPFR